jgi:hypothetical protein
LTKITIVDPANTAIMKINELTDQLEKCDCPATLLADDLLTKDRGITSRTSDVQIRYDNSAHVRIIAFLFSFLSLRFHFA